MGSFDINIVLGLEDGLLVVADQWTFIIVAQLLLCLVFVFVKLAAKLLRCIDYFAFLHVLLLDLPLECVVELGEELFLPLHQ